MFHRMFKAEKAVQAAGVLLRAEHNRMSYLRLLKLLYIADREMLQESGQPILGGAAVAMDHGPLHSAVYDLVKGERWDEAVWFQFIERDGYHVHLQKDPGVRKLCRYEIRKLNQVAERFARQDDWEVVRCTHGFVEWRDHYHEGTSTPIPWESIIAAVGREGELETIRQDAAQAIAIEEFFTGLQQ